jgi:nucleoid-associated protein YgaU
MLIYDANKRVIGDDPNRVKPGLVLQIPELPDKLKD